jgi:hypothetical protein
LKLDSFSQYYVKQEEIRTSRQTNTMKIKRCLSIGSLNCVRSKELIHVEPVKTIPKNTLSNRSVTFAHNHDDNHLSNASSTNLNQRTCGARFVCGTYLICFGRTTPSQQEPVSMPSTLNTNNDRLHQRSHQFHIRSTSLTVTATRDEQVSRSIDPLFFSCSYE